MTLAVDVHPVSLPLPPRPSRGSTSLNISKRVYAGTIGSMPGRGTYGDASAGSMRWM